MFLTEVLFQVDDQMKLLQDSWSEMLILDHMHHRMHNNLPDETQLPNGQVGNHSEIENVSKVVIACEWNEAFSDSIYIQNL